ncbi:hypothetical protein ARMGADRAFT_1044038 [Armillaria gallica]|uniref:CxC2-like cysteine cluster KDZ transposase-associated domain-containing protein n=1 Tax=Armillaria gallica TaxID=47427 RepID=A0A2H3EGB3_ARMGA|nr:hypothetical protein ARMGADRAFT_1044038 [Armillaria gallica]
MIREYHHLLLLLHGGKGNEVNGATNVGPGELTMECLACPRLQVNLPEDWHLVPVEKKKLYLYHKVVGIDANFRMMNLLRSDDIANPGLHMGFAYFVMSEQNKHHVAVYATQKDISTCSRFKTLSHMETKNSTGLRVTGVVMCLCAHHEMVGALYYNTNYITCSALTGCDLSSIFFSYDIACQWFVGFKVQMEELPDTLKLSSEIQMDCGVPKLHCHTHKLECQCHYSLNIQPGMRRTDGESIEHVWSIMNRCASSMKEMGLGS